VIVCLLVNPINFFSSCAWLFVCLLWLNCYCLPGLPSAAIEPVPESSVSTVEERSQEDRERWWKMGLKAISDGKLAVLILSGGQVYLNLFWMNIRRCFFFFFNFFCDWKIMNDNNDVLFQHCLIQVGASYVYV